MNVLIRESNLFGMVESIPSKSVAHRMLISAALSGNKSAVICQSSSKDIDATIRCLNALGAKICAIDGGYSISPIPMEKTDMVKRQSCKDPVDLPCGESGSTMRFLLPLLGVLGGNYRLITEGRLAQRPLSPLKEMLEQHGMHFHWSDSSILNVDGSLQPGLFELAGNVSSQFFSGLFFALPLLNERSAVISQGDLESKPYLDLTLSTLRQYGIKVEFSNHEFSIDGNQCYHAPKCTAVEGDWSSAGAWVCAGALSDTGIRCCGLDRYSEQGDRAIVEVVQRFGAMAEWLEDGTLLVRKKELHGIHYNAENTPDLVPVIAALACGAEGTTVITGAARLRIKESDRIASVCSILRALGARIFEYEDGMKIIGEGNLAGGTEVMAFHDHRIAMCAALAGSLCKQPILLRNAECVSKSYPTFWDDYSKLHGEIAVLTKDTAEKGES